VTAQFFKKNGWRSADFFKKFDSGRNINVAAPPLPHNAPFSGAVSGARGNVGEGGAATACAYKSSKWMLKKSMVKKRYDHSGFIPEKLKIGRSPYHGAVFSRPTRVGVGFPMPKRLRAYQVSGKILA
jgi:hypothetical protein